MSASHDAWDYEVATKVGSGLFLVSERHTKKLVMLLTLCSVC